MNVLVRGMFLIISNLEMDPKPIKSIKTNQLMNIWLHIVLYETDNQEWIGCAIPHEEKQSKVQLWYPAIIMSWCNLILYSYPRCRTILWPANSNSMSLKSPDWTKTSTGVFYSAWSYARSYTCAYANNLTYYRQLNKITLIVYVVMLSSKLFD